MFHQSLFLILPEQLLSKRPKIDRVLVDCRIQFDQFKLIKDGLADLEIKSRLESPLNHLVLLTMRA